MMKDEPLYASCALVIFVMLMMDTLQQSKFVELSC